MPIVRSIGTSLKCCKCSYEFKNHHKTVKKCPSCGSFDFARPLVENIPGEEWKRSSLNNKYEVSNYGRLRNAIKRKGTYLGCELKGTINHDGYLRNGGKAFFHVLVAHEFLGPKPKGYECNHKDGNKLNNRVENLEYTTHAENMAHAGKIGLMRSGDENWNAKLRTVDIVQIFSLKKSGANNPTIARFFNVDQSSISRIINGRSWKGAASEYASKDV
jgi:predicted  nucleic acid-binding Zn-ribbon protein